MRKKLLFIPFLVPIFLVVYLMITNAPPISFNNFEIKQTNRIYVVILIFLCLLLIKNIEKTYQKKTIEKALIVYKLDLFFFKMIILKGRIPLVISPSNLRYNQVTKNSFLLIESSIVGRVLLWVPYKENTSNQ